MGTSIISGIFLVFLFLFLIKRLSRRKQWRRSKLDMDYAEWKFNQMRDEIRKDSEKH